jgi:superfamily II DNA/RNA helicase
MLRLMWLCDRAEGQLGSAKIGLLHGRLAPEEKIAALEAFSSGETPVLISTTVVEVCMPCPPPSLCSLHCPHMVDYISHIHRVWQTAIMRLSILRCLDIAPLPAGRWAWTWWRRRSWWWSTPTASAWRSCTSCAAG